MSSVCLSVCPSVTLVDCDHIGWKFPAFSWVLEEWLVVGKSCLSVAYLSVSVHQTASLMVDLVAQWYGTPLISKYSARRKNRVAQAPRILYIAKSWARADAPTSAL